MNLLKVIIANIFLAIVWLVIQSFILPLKAGMWIYYLIFDRNSGDSRFSNG
jgi:multisubunit Na+/H+ antiporter MnhE subunit